MIYIMSIMTTNIIYSKKFNSHDASGHPENAQRLNILFEDIRNSPLQKEVNIVEPSLLPEEILFDVHSENMIAEVKEISEQGDGWIDLDTYVSKGDYETARLAAGGLLDACFDVLDGTVENAFGLIRPPGHHATANQSMGFCLFNNIAFYSGNSRSNTCTYFSYQCFSGYNT